MIEAVKNAISWAPNKRNFAGQIVAGDRIWSPFQVEYLRANYADHTTEEIASALGFKATQVSVKARQLKLRKSSEHIQRLLAIEAVRLKAMGAATRYLKGSVPANTGLKMAPNAESQRTQFKHGNLSHTWVPVGSLSKVDGYWKRKVSDHRRKSDWVYCHIDTWTAAHGLIPKNHCVCFRDRNPDNYALENLHLLNRTQLMAENTIARYPEVLRMLIRMSRKLDRKIREQQDEK